MDLFADVDYGRFGFVPFMDLRDEMAAWLGCKVDFTTRNGLHRDLRDRVAKSAVKVFDAVTTSSTITSRGMSRQCTFHN